jgi:ribonuclease T1
MLRGKNAIFVVIAVVLALGFLAIRGKGEPVLPSNAIASVSAIATASATPTASANPTAVVGPTATATASVSAPANPKPIGSTGDAARDAQVRRVIESVDATKKPPEGVAQGGNPPGMFKNREGRLPRGGTYIESDIWPSRGRSRGVERLVFGQNGDVWFTEDHYETFKKIR